MPIVFNEETSKWDIKDPTPAEVTNLVRLGKKVLVEGIGGSLVNEQYRVWLDNAEDQMFFHA